MGESPVYGGRWDTWGLCYSDDEPENVIELPISPWQWEILQPMIEGKNTKTLVSAGRGSGKSMLLLAGGLARGLQTPFGACQLISPTFSLSQLLWDKVLDDLPGAALLHPEWGEQRGLRRLVLVNGYTFRFGSADRPKSMRAADADDVLVDERQDVRQRAIDIVTFQMRKRGGYRMMQIGTPELGSEFHGEWEKYLAKMAEGSERHLMHEGTSYQNPFIPHDVFDDAKDDMDSMLYDQEVLGKWVSLSPRAFHCFDSAAQVKPIANARDVLSSTHGLYQGVGRDITAEFTRRKFGRESDYIMGADLRVLPTVASVWKVFRGPPSQAIDHEDVIAWQVDEVVIEKVADARDLVRECRKRGYSGHFIIPRQFRNNSQGISGFRLMKQAGASVTCTPEVLDGVNRRNSWNAKARAKSGRTTLLIDPRCIKQIKARETQAPDENGGPKEKCFEDHHTMAGDVVIDHLWPAAASVEALRLGYAT